MNKPGFRIFGFKAIVNLLIAVGFISILCSKSNAQETENLFDSAIRQFNANELDSALNNFRLIINLLPEVEDVKGITNAKLFVADIKRLKQEFDSAFYYLNIAEYLLKKSFSRADPLWADYYHRKGSVYLSQGAYEKANVLFRQSIDLRIDTSGSSDTNLVLTYNNLGISSYYLGLFDQAMTNYKKALEIIDQGNISRNRHVAFCYQNTGILHATLGDYEQAAKYFSLTQEVFESLFEQDDMNLGRFYLNFGRMMQLAGKTEEALEQYNKAENIFINNVGHDHASVGIIFLNKANIYNNYSDYDRAVHYNNRALAIFQKSLSPDHPNILSVYLNLGYYYEKKEDYTTAIEYYLKSIYPERITQLNIKTYRNMANLYDLIQDKELADVYFNKAIQHSIEIFGLNHPETALSYTSYARFLTLNGSYSKALDYLNRAKVIYLNRLGPESRDFANVLFRIGGNYYERGNYVEALKYYQQSIVALTNGFADLSVDVNPLPEQLVADQFLLNSLLLKARTLHEIFSQNKNLDYLYLSLQTYDLSAQLLNKIRSSYLSDESKLMITGITNDILIGALDCALELYNLTADRTYLKKAFEYSEKGKAAVLLASLNDLEARQLARVPDEIVRFERSLQHSLDSYNQLIYEERLRNVPDETKINLWQTMVFEFNQRYDSLIHAIYQEYPDYYDLRFDLSIISLPDLQESLSKNQALIEYTLGENVLYIFAVTSDSLVAIRKDMPEMSLEYMNELRNHLTGMNIHDYRISDFNDFIHISHEVYKLLLQPVEKIIADKKLIIVPDNQLGYLPFEVLLYSDFDATSLDFKNLPYLVKKHPVSYAYSATLLDRKSRKESRSNGRVLAFAPEYNNNNGISYAAGRHQDLMPIPWAIDEAESLARLYRGRALTGDNATEARFKEKSSDYLVLHLAMHTLINNDNPMFSRLVFAPPADTLEDGFLNTYELFNLELNASLAVLSACQTGDGRLQRGEGIMSMARGFFYAGVPSIIMTLWEVDDQSSSQLVGLFYQYLAKGYEKDEALRSAKLEYLQATDRLKAHPHFWAAYVNIGNTDPVPLQKARSIWIFIIPSLIFAALVLFLIRRKRRSQI